MRARVLAAAAFAILALHLASATDRSFWEDEVVTVSNASRPVGEILSIPERYEGPFFLLLVKAWSFAGEREFVVRVLPCLLALAGAAVVFRFVRKEVGPAAAVLTSALLAVSPAFSLWTREVRPYGLLFLLTAATAAAWWGYVRGGRRNLAFLASLLATLAFWFQQAFLLQALALALWPALVRTPRSRLCGIWLFAGPAATVALAAVAWPDLFTTIANNARVQLAGGAPSIPFGAPGRLGYGLFAFALGQTVYPLNGLVVGPAFFGFAIAVGLGLRALPRDSRIFWILWAFLPLAIAAVWGVRFAPQYAVPSLAPFCVIVAMGILRAGSWGKRGALGACIAIPAIVASLNDFAGREHHNLARVEPVREAVSWIYARGLGEGDTVIVAPDHVAVWWYLHRLSPGRIAGRGRAYYLICSPGQKPDPEGQIAEARRGAEAMAARLGPPTERVLWAGDPLAESKARWIRKPFLRHRLELWVWDKSTPGD